MPNAGAGVVCDGASIGSGIDAPPPRAGVEDNTQADIETRDSFILSNQNCLASKQWRTGSDRVQKLAFQSDLNASRSEMAETLPMSMVIEWAVSRSAARSVA